MLDGTDGMPRVSVIIPVLNEVAYIDQQLEALACEKPGTSWEVIVADNGSIDGTQQEAERWVDRLPLRVIDASARPWAAAARNIAVDSSSSEVLLFCDADDVIAPGWVAAHVRSLEQAVVSAGAVVYFEDEAPDASFEVPSQPPRYLGWLPYALGANCGVRREVFDLVGGFPEHSPCAEDVEFSWLAQLAGCELRYEPDAVVFKRHRANTRDRFVQSYRYGKCDVDMYRRFRTLGATYGSASSVARTYGGLVARLPWLGSTEVRDRWIRQLGRRAGRLVASAQHHTWCP